MPSKLRRSRLPIEMYNGRNPMWWRTNQSTADVMEEAAMGEPEVIRHSLAAENFGQFAAKRFACGSFYSGLGLFGPGERMQESSFLDLTLTEGRRHMSIVERRGNGLGGRCGTGCASENGAGRSCCSTAGNVRFCFSLLFGRSFSLRTLRVGLCCSVISEEACALI